jgi:hypothetical protein
MRQHHSTSRFQATITLVLELNQVSKCEFQVITYGKKSAQNFIKLGTQINHLSKMQKRIPQMKVSLSWNGLGCERSG